MKADNTGRIERVRKSLDTAKIITMSDARQKRNLASATQEYAHRVHKYFSDGIWHNSPCFIIGGGKSLRDFDLTTLNGQLTIGINMVMKYMDPTIFYTMDRAFWTSIEKGEYGEDFKNKFTNYDKGYKVVLNTRLKYDLFPPDVFPIRLFQYHHRFSPSIKEGIGGGQNSGFGALNLAICLGANPIYLLGFDMNNDGSKDHHFHTLYKGSRNKPTTVYDMFKARFEQLTNEELRGRKIINLNPNSGLKKFPRAEYKESLKTNMPVVVSFYTDDEIYSKFAAGFREIMKGYSLDMDIQKISRSSGWLSTVSYKPKFIKQMMLRYPNRSILWVDIDGLIRRYPIHLNNLKASAAFVMWRSELLSGTLYFDNSQESRQIVDDWIARQEEVSNQRGNLRWDQKTLQYVIRKNKYPNIQYLPNSYCQIFDLMADTSENPVIEHFQASRQAKPRYGNT